MRAVEGIIDPAKIMRNPFNGASVFLPPNEPQNANPGKPIPGAIACAFAPDSSTGGNFNYYAFVFQGTDSTRSSGMPSLADFHAGMGYPAGASFPLDMLRQGIFFTKVRQ